MPILVFPSARLRPGGSICIFNMFHTATNHAVAMKKEIPEKSVPIKNKKTKNAPF
jgi:hypothetical protein